MENVQTKCSDLTVKASVKFKPHFKAGAELAKVVSIMVNDSSDEDSEALDITLHIRSCGEGEKVNS